MGTVTPGWNVLRCVVGGLSAEPVPGEVGSLHFWELATRGQWGLGMQEPARLEVRAVQESILSMLGAVYRADLTHKIRTVQCQKDHRQEPHHPFLYWCPDKSAWYKGILESLRLRDSLRRFGQC